MKGFSILLVEDNRDHADLIRRAFERSSTVDRVVVARDGQMAVDYLYRQGGYTDPEAAPRPDLILLDIKLPKLDGFEVLQKIKSDRRLGTIPVVMLTTSSREEEVHRACRLGANSYVCKPVRFRDFMEAIQGIEGYWLSVNKLPRVRR